MDYVLYSDSFYLKILVSCIKLEGIVCSFLFFVFVLKEIRLTDSEAVMQQPC